MLKSELHLVKSEPIVSSSYVFLDFQSNPADPGPGFTPSVMPVAGNE